MADEKDDGMTSGQLFRALFYISAVTLLIYVGFSLYKDYIPSHYMRIHYKALVNGQDIKFSDVVECRPSRSRPIGEGSSIEWSMTSESTGIRMNDGSTLLVEIPHFCAAILYDNYPETHCEGDCVPTPRNIKIVPRTYWIPHSDTPQYYEAYLSPAYFVQTSARVSNVESYVELLPPGERPQFEADHLVRDSLWHMTSQAAGTAHEPVYFQGTTLVPWPAGQRGRFGDGPAATSESGRFEYFRAPDTFGEEDRDYSIAINTFVSGSNLFSLTPPEFYFRARGNLRFTSGRAAFDRMVPLKEMTAGHFSADTQLKALTIRQATSRKAPLLFSGEEVEITIDGDRTKLPLNGASMREFLVWDTKEEVLYRMLAM